MKFATTILFGTTLLAASMLHAQIPLPTQISLGRQQLARGEYAAAQATFAAYARTHEKNALAEMGIGEAEFGLREYAEAEFAYRLAVLYDPQLWTAHKALVLVEAKLRRWDEFDRERAILRAARERGAANITRRESDAIDSFTVGTRLWSVREYFEPAGRSEARYNFEGFDDGRGAEYISLEPKTAADSALQRDAQVRIGEGQRSFGEVAVWALNWYSDAGHGTIRTYAGGEPRYESVRADVRRWLLAQTRVQARVKASVRPRRPR